MKKEMNITIIVTILVTVILNAMIFENGEDSNLLVRMVVLLISYIISLGISKITTRA